MPQVQDQSRNLLTCSPVHYHYAMAAPNSVKSTSQESEVTGYEVITVTPIYNLFNDFGMQQIILHSLDLDKF